MKGDKDNDEKGKSIKLRKRNHRESWEITHFQKTMWSNNVNHTKTDKMQICLDWIYKQRLITLKL